MSGHTCPRVLAQTRIPAIHRPPMHAAKGPYYKSTDFTVCAQASPTAVLPCRRLLPLLLILSPAIPARFHTNWEKKTKKTKNKSRGPGNLPLVSLFRQKVSVWKVQYRKSHGLNMGKATGKEMTVPTWKESLSTTRGPHSLIETVFWKHRQKSVCV